MTWNKLNKTQQNECRRLLEDLRAAGVSETVSQVAKYYDDVLDWKARDITLAELCKRTGWTDPTPEPTKETAKPATSEPKPEAPAAAEPEQQPDATVTRIKQRATRVRELRAALSAELGALRTDITTADEEGTGRNEIVRAADGGLSKAKVFEHLGYTDMRTATEKAIKAVGVPHRIYVSLHEQPAGQLNIRVDTEPDFGLQGDDREPEDDHDRASHARSEWITRCNFLGDVQHELRQHGFTLHVEGETEPNEAIASGAAGRICKRAGA